MASGLSLMIRRDVYPNKMLAGMLVMICPGILSLVLLF
jgi:hypothetical protein